MSLFITITAVIFSLTFIAFAVKTLVDYCFSKSRKHNREAQIADRHDKLLQEYHFYKDNSGK